MKSTPIRDPYPARRGYWFRSKAFGFGAVPVTWQGWLATAVFVVTAALLGNAAEHRGSVWLVVLAALMLFYLGLVWVKTDGGWGWRWGSDK